MPDLPLAEQLAISRRENRRLLAVVAILQAQLEQVVDCQVCRGCAEQARDAIRLAGQATGGPEPRKKHRSESSKNG